MTSGHEDHLGGHSPLPPDLIPARMANEDVYCPRLGYLEENVMQIRHVVIKVDDQDKALVLLCHKSIDAGVAA